MWLPLILVTAFFISLQDVSGKKIVNCVDVYVLAWASFFFSLPVIGVCLLVVEPPALGPLFWRSLTISSILLVIASIYYFRAIKYSDLSIAVPMLAFTPAILLITSPLMLGEFPSPLGILGIILIVAGSYVLHLRANQRDIWEPFRSLAREKGSRYMLMVAILFSLSANMDKIGVLQSSPFFWIFTLNSVLAVVLGVIMLRRTAHIKDQIRKNWPFLVAVGVSNGLALIFQMTAIQMTLIPYLIAVKRTSIIMTSLFGFIIFKEKGFKERFIGVILMVLGVFMISIFQ